MIEPCPALVRPRVLVPDGTGAVLLEDEVLSHLERQRPGLIEIAGPPGSGKSTSLAHLAHLFGDEPFIALATADSDEAIAALCAVASDHLVIFKSSVRIGIRGIASAWRLAPWTQEDCIEYLLAAHRQQCASVMRRVQGDADWSWLRGSPELCSAVLNRLAMDDTLQSAKPALRQELQSRMHRPAVRQAAGQYCADMLSEHASQGIAAAKLLQSSSIELELRSLLRHEPVQILQAAQHLAEVLKTNQAATVLSSQPTDVLIREIADLIRTDERTIGRLRKFAFGRDSACHAMAASLLHAAHIGWTPQRQKGLLLMGAYLQDAKWPQLRLIDANISHANLSRADLTEARLQDITAQETQLDRSDLHGAVLDRLVAPAASFSDADLSYIRATAAQLYGANLSRANFEGARLPQAEFQGADLSHARLRRAVLVKANFTGCTLEGADFTCADLSYVELSDMTLRGADFAGACFDHAILRRCDLEYLRLPGAKFDQATLRYSHLTGTEMPNSHFHKADLRDTGLAEIEWERADLRDADLRGCTFHLGSSRSGLVGSPIACEGSKTGFYQDEFHEQDFKAPEEIRKANLCGADLRGARIDNVDFYLVDLRHARYTPQQADHLRACGAILEARV